MILCEADEGCWVWYHFECEGLIVNDTVDETEDVDLYACRGCRAAGVARTTYKDHSSQSDGATVMGDDDDDDDGDDYDDDAMDYEESSTAGYAPSSNESLTSASSASFHAQDSVAAESDADFPAGSDAGAPASSVVASHQDGAPGPGVLDFFRGDAFFEELRENVKERAGALDEFMEITRLDQPYLHQLITANEMEFYDLFTEGWSQELIDRVGDASESTLR